MTVTHLTRAMTPWKPVTRLAVLLMALIVCTAATAFGQDDQEYKRVYNAAIEAAKAKNYTEAYRLYTQAATLAEQAGDQDVVTSSNRVLAQLEFALSQRSLKQENYEQALKQAEQGIARNPEYAGNYYSKGLALKNLDRIDEAMDALAKAIEVAEASSDRRIASLAENAIREQFTFLASSALTRNGENIRRSDAEEALAHLAKLEQYNIEPDADVYYYMAEAYAALGNYEQAVAMADQALEIHRGSRTDKAKIYLIKGEALMNQGDATSARAALENALFGQYRQRAQYLLDELGS